MNAEICSNSNILKHQAFQKEFREATDLGFFLYCPQNTDTDLVPQEKICPYCAAVQQIFGQEACRECNRIAYEHACKQNQYFIYRCHAGLLNAVIPFARDDKTVDAVFIGQVITENDTTRTAFSTLLGHTDIPTAQVDRLYGLFIQTDQCQKDKFLLVVQLLSMLKEYSVSMESKAYIQQQIRAASIAPSLSMEKTEDGQAPEPGMAYYTPQKPHIVKKAEEIVRTQYGNQLSCNEIAAAVHLSSNYFGTLFKKFTGHCFKDYLNIVRIEQSRNLLATTNRPIKQICAEVGFEDYNYFNRVFKKYIGFPPAAYRSSLPFLVPRNEADKDEKNGGTSILPFHQTAKTESRNASEKEEMLQFLRSDTDIFFRAVNYRGL